MTSKSELRDSLYNELFEFGLQPSDWRLERHQDPEKKIHLFYKDKFDKLDDALQKVNSIRNIIDKKRPNYIKSTQKYTIRILVDESKRYLIDIREIAQAIISHKKEEQALRKQALREQALSEQDLREEARRADLYLWSTDRH